MPFGSFKVCLAFLIVVSGSLPGCYDAPDATAETYVERARKQIAEGALSAGVIELRNALQQDPRHAAARALLGQVYLQLGDGLGAERQLLRARDLGRYGHAERSALIQSRLLLGEHKAALKEIPEPLSGENEETTQLLILRGEAFLGMGRLEEAARDFETALISGPDPAAFAGLARIALEMSDMETAERHLAEGLTHNPADPELITLNGKRLMRAEEFAVAETEFGRAVALVQNRPMLSARLGLARAQLAQGKLEDAKVTLQEAAKIAPQNGSVVLLQAFVALARHEYDTANELAQQIINVDKRNLIAIGIAGVSSYFLERFEQANRLLSIYVHRLPGDHEVRQVLGATKLRLGMPASAFDTLQVAAEAKGVGVGFRTLAGFSAIVSVR